MTRTDSPGRRPTYGKQAMVLALTAATAAPAAGQYGTYIVPGSLAERREQSREVLLKTLQDARWRWGPVRIDPQLSIGNVGWVENVYNSSQEEAEGDVRAQASAGLRASINLGPKVVTSAFVDASYAWWRNQDALRNLNESYGLLMLGMFNRLQVQLQGGRVANQRNLSSEVEAPVDLQADRVELSFDVDPRGPLVVFGGASKGRIRYFGLAAQQQIPGLDVTSLDRDTEALSLGLRYEFGSGLGIGLGLERAEGAFQQDPEGRSSKSTGPLLRIGVQGNRLSLHVDAVWRRIEFRGRSAGPDRQQVTGVSQIGWEFSDRLSAALYGSRQLQFSARDSRAAFDGQRSGVSLARAAGRSSQVQLFFETGSDEYFNVASDRITRRDDFNAYGAGFKWEITPRLTLELAFTDARYDSSDPDFNRDVASITSRLSLGGNLLPW